MTKAKPNAVAICVSHKEDVDGIASAMLIKRLFEPKLITLVDYANMIEGLSKLADTYVSGDKKRLNELFICDLALSKKNEKEFVEIVRRFVAEGVKVTYVDHHDLSKETESELQTMKLVQLLHNIEECTSVQIYEHYKEQMDDHAAFHAAAAALTDYMDHKPVATTLVRRFDRQFLMLQATALSYIISANQHDDSFLVELVKTLSEGKYTHDVKNGFSIARDYAKMVGDAAKEIETSMKKLKNLAYASSTSILSTSMVVNFVLGTSGKPVAVIYKPRDDMPGSCQISVRGTQECKLHLGRTVNGIATELGGNGGGHEKACGAIIPESMVSKFIRLLDKAVK